MEISPNHGKKLYDEAVSVLREYCQGQALESVTSIKFHANTWGLSSCNWFADEIVTKMRKLQVLDFSDTVHSQHRSDLCMGIKAILTAATDKEIEFIDLSDNDLDFDGARAFYQFLSKSSSIKRIKATNCNLGDKSATMILEAVKLNPKLMLKNIDISGNNFSPQGISDLFKSFEFMKSLTTLNFSNIIKTPGDSAAMKLFLIAVKDCRSLRHLDISCNMGTAGAIP